MDRPEARAFTSAAGQLGRLVLGEDSHTGVGPGPVRQYHCATDLLIAAARVNAKIDGYLHTLIELRFGLILQNTLPTVIQWRQRHDW